MPEEKAQPTSTPSDRDAVDPQSDDALDQETLDQLIAGSQPEGDEADQLESMLADLDESADDEPAEGGESLPRLQKRPI